MRKGGIGGGNTLTGLQFEFKTDLANFIKNLDGYNLKDNVLKKGNSIFFDIYFNEEFVGHIIQKHALYLFLENEGIDWKSVLSKKILPDDSIFVLLNNTVFIIEKKYQEVAGSVDEKLQTCDFKKKQYQKLFSLLNIDVEYIYLLNDWFAKNEYRDVLNYIHSVDCQYYFNYIPFNVFGLPLPTKN